MKKHISFVSAMLIALMSAAAAFGVALNVSAKSSTELDILHGDMWTGNVKIDSRYVNGSNAISVSPDNDESGFSFYCDLEPVDFSEYNELCFEISLRGELAEYDMTISFESGPESESITKTVKCGGIQKLYIPISGEISSSLDRIEISVPGENRPIYAVISGISADDNYTYAAIENFDSDNVTCSVGTLIPGSDGMLLSPNGTDAEVSIDFLSDTSDDTAYIVWLDIASNGAAGNISIDTKAVGDDDKATVSAYQILAAGEHSYTFFVEGAFESLKFVFDTLSFSAKDSSIRLTGAGVLKAGNIRNTEVGMTSSCRFENGKVTVSGIINDSTALQYVDSRLGLYAVPVWDSVDEAISAESDIRPNVTSSFSTRFSLSVDIPSDQWRTYLYQPVIITESENIPIGDPVTAQMPTAATSQSAVSGLLTALDGAEQYGVVESGVASEIIDIYADKLLSGSETSASSLYSHRGKVYYMDADYLNSVKRRLEFDAAIGIKVFARIIYTNDESMFDVKDEDSLCLADAVCSCIRNELGKSITGYIIGRELNTAELFENGCDESLSVLIALFTEGLRGSAGAEIYLPFSDKGYINPFAAYAAVRYSMSRHGAAAVSFMYVCSDVSESAAASVSRTVSVANSYGFTTEGGAIVYECGEKSDADDAALYAKLCKSAQGLRLAALKIDSDSADMSVYSELKNAMINEKAFSADVKLFSANKENNLGVGKYELLSYDASYDTSGWFSGGAFIGVMTDPSALQDGRALRSYSGGSGITGLLAHRFDKPVDMSKTGVELSFGIAAEFEGSAEVKVIFGNSDLKREYSANVEYNKPVKLYCNMNDVSTPIDYAVIAVRGNEDCTVEFYSVSLRSGELSDDEMRERYDTGRSSNIDPLLYVVIIVLAAGTVAVFSAFAKKKEK